MRSPRRLSQYRPANSFTNPQVLLGAQIFVQCWRHTPRILKDELALQSQQLDDKDLKATELKYWIADAHRTSRCKPGSGDPAAPAWLPSMLGDYWVLTGFGMTIAPKLWCLTKETSPEPRPMSLSLVRNDLHLQTTTLRPTTSSLASSDSVVHKVLDVPL